MLPLPDEEREREREEAMSIAMEVDTFVLCNGMYSCGTVSTALQCDSEIYFSPRSVVRSELLAVEFC